MFCVSNAALYRIRTVHANVVIADPGIHIHSPVVLKCVVNAECCLGRTVIVAVVFAVRLIASLPVVVKCRH